MWKRLFKRHPVQTVMGHRIPEPRLTWMALGWAFLYLGLPVLLVGTLIDGLIQLTTGVCTGLWCFF
ncbi:MAG: hypothetical protein EBW49_02590 [Betaproteobacteria bacterium]|nr:hypothetical protein [Betaproteobacteria bacterium]NDG15396.1 hypothetical protein [Betaproteobacteria bacterium]